MSCLPTCLWFSWTRYQDAAKVGEIKRVCGARSSIPAIADDAFLATSELDLWHALDHFTAVCKLVGMKISTPKSEVMVISEECGMLPSIEGRYCP